LKQFDLLLEMHLNISFKEHFMANSITNTIFTTLPGVELPVKDVASELAHMWSEIAESEGSEFRASQLNLILHYGLNVSAAEAQRHFDAAIAFAQRYPCRIIVLCPTPKLEGVDGMVRSKLFSLCYLGPSLREACCCEALILNYETADFAYLVNQVSVWLEGDLPTYHWFCQVPAQRIKEHYLDFLRLVQKVVINRSLDEPDLFELKWPENCRCVDLAIARTLPIRQALGQFLSRFPISDLRQGLVSIKVSHCPAFYGEATALLQWQQHCLGMDSKESSSACQFTTSEMSHSCAEVALRIDWNFKNKHFLVMAMGEHNGTACLAYDFGAGKDHATLQVACLPLDRALSEALFFSGTSINS
jgi:hypothetical protein